MTKRDFQAIARAIHESEISQLRICDENQKNIVLECHSGTASRIANVLAESNPRFDRARFIEACETGKCKGMPR